MVNERSLKWYHENKDKIDREARKEYMKKYYEAKKHKWKERCTPEERSKRNEARRLRYATDEEYREKHKRDVKDYRARNPTQKRASELAAKYNLTFEEYQQLVENQGGGCAICGRVASLDLRKTGRTVTLHVDHCHSTGVVRGVLCSSCNLGIGKFGDNAELLMKASVYLSKFQEPRNVQD